MEYQTEFLSYNKIWEFPQNRLRLGLNIFAVFLRIIYDYLVADNTIKFNTKVGLFYQVQKLVLVASVESLKPKLLVSKTLMKLRRQ
jgi:hypothetical protein